MSATTPKRRVSAVATLAILAAVSALYILASGDYDYDRDDVDYYHRQLFQLALDPHSCSAHPRPSCDGVLITSQGGVASTEFITALDDAMALEGGGASFCVNDRRDVDGFKHRPAWAYRHNSTSLIGSRTAWGRETCFRKVLVIVGDPVHTVESTYRRFRMTHINKVRRAVGLTDYPRITGLSTLYRHIASSEKDQTGITSYVESWYDAIQDRSNWPEVRLVTARMLLDNAEEHARWIGVGQEGLSRFSRMRYEAWRQHKTWMSVADGDVRGKVREVFGNVTEIIRLLEATPPLVPIRQGRRRRRRRTAHKF